MISSLSCFLKLKSMYNPTIKLRGRGAEAFEDGVQHSGVVIFLAVFGQLVATHRRTRLEGILAVLGEI
jgi:hypothetical protein